MYPLAALLLSAIAEAGAAQSGLANGTTVELPRQAAVVAIDGRLDAPEWSSAATLTGVSQYATPD